MWSELSPNSAPPLRNTLVGERFPGSTGAHDWSSQRIGQQGFSRRCSLALKPCRQSRRHIVEFPAARLARSPRIVPPDPALSMLLPVGFCAPTCIPLVNCPAIGIGSFAFKNSNRQCKSHEGGKLSPQKLQGTYLAALSRIAGATLCEDAKRHTPIFQRRPAVGERQAIRDAADALAALWKIREPIKRGPSIKIQSKAGEP